MTDTIRAFTAIELHARDRLVPAYYLSRLHESEVPGLKVDTLDQMHITLNFLGDLLPEQIPDVMDALIETMAQPKHFRDTKVKPFYGRVQGFPPRILYLPVEKSDQVVRLQSALQTALRIPLKLEESIVGERFGVDFLPHVTLGRLPKDTPPEDFHSVLRWLQGTKDFACVQDTLFLAGVSLMKSVREDNGHISYERVGFVGTPNR